MTDVRYAVVDPSTGEVVQTYPTATDSQVFDAVAEAHGAFRSWARSAAVADRAALVRRVSELHSERREELAAIINREMGKSVEDALFEIDFTPPTAVRPPLSSTTGFVIVAAKRKKAPAPTSPSR